MTERITLTEETFELPESIPWQKDQDVILGIRLFNLTLARKVMKQILQDQERSVKCKQYHSQEFIETYNKLFEKHDALQIQYNYLKTMREQDADIEHKMRVENLGLKEKSQKYEKIKKAVETSGNVPFCWSVIQDILQEK